MCPLRFILVFFSTVLAGYFAWKTVRSSPENVFNVIGSDDDLKKDDQKQLNCQKTLNLKNGFWVFVDMASGRYLWKNLRNLKQNL